MCIRDRHYEVGTLGNHEFNYGLDYLADAIKQAKFPIINANVVKVGTEAVSYTHLQIIRMSAEEFTQAMNGVREFNRLKGIDLKTYQCNTIFVDPPRAGLDPDTVKLVQNYDRILYISCNPHTLCENLQTLSQTHRIEKAALFDQFPYTDHMESGVWLVRK